MRDLAVANLDHFHRNRLVEAHRLRLDFVGTIGAAAMVGRDLDLGRPDVFGAMDLTQGHLVPELIEDPPLRLRAEELTLEPLDLAGELVAGLLQSTVRLLQRGVGLHKFNDLGAAH